MSNDPDACLPAVVTDFVFDLSDSVLTSHIAEEQSKFYSVTFRELSAKYFATSPWPSPQSIASECNGDPQFLALYREVTHRHWHSVSRPTLRDRIEGWHVYRELFDELLDDSDGSDTKNIFLLPEWTFDILHEFVYQFQGFCQFRAAVHASAKKHGLDFGGSGDTSNAPHHLVEHLAVLHQQSDAWRAETVLSYLERFVSNGASSTCAAYQHLGLCACVALSRLQCLLGDYKGCLAAMDRISTYRTVQHHDDEGKSPEDVVQGVFAARLSGAYHAGVAHLQLRRYRDAMRTLSEICVYMQRGFKTGQLRKLPNSEQFSKLYDRMICLLAIVTHVAPISGVVEESVLKTIREKHGSQLGKIDAGEEDYEDLFVYSCPKFISPSPSEDNYKLQVKHFMKEMSSQHASRKLRSYMKLYTSIGIDKLAAFNDMGRDEFLPLLLSYKLKMRQVEGDDDKIGSALDIHYYLMGDTVHVDEAEKQRRFENYFMAQIAQNNEIIRDVEAITTTL